MQPNIIALLNDSLVDLQTVAERKQKAYFLLVHGITRERQMCSATSATRNSFTTQYFLPKTSRTLQSLYSNATLLKLKNPQIVKRSPVA